MRVPSFEITFSICPPQRHRFRVDLLALSGLRAQPLLLLTQLGRELLAEILRLEHLPNLELHVAVLDRPALDPLDAPLPSTAPESS